ncbi:MAG: hypothetical protein ABIV63_15390 [Caldimonas sp.]
MTEPGQKLGLDATSDIGRVPGQQGAVGVLRRVAARSLRLATPDWHLPDHTGAQRHLLNDGHQRRSAPEVDLFGLSLDLERLAVAIPMAAPLDFRVRDHAGFERTKISIEVGSLDDVSHRQLSEFGFRVAVALACG